MNNDSKLSPPSTTAMEEKSLPSPAPLISRDIYTSPLLKLYEPQSEYCPEPTWKSQEDPILKRPRTARRRTTSGKKAFCPKIGPKTEQKNNNDGMMPGTPPKPEPSRMYQRISGLGVIPLSNESHETISQIWNCSNGLAECGFMVSQDVGRLAPFSKRTRDCIQKDLINGGVDIKGKRLSCLMMSMSPTVRGLDPFSSDGQTSTHSLVKKREDRERSDPESSLSPPSTQSSPFGRMLRQGTPSIEDL